MQFLKTAFWAVLAVVIALFLRQLETGRSSAFAGRSS